MAKIKFGMMMTDARGKLGGQVFSKNRSGAYVRTKVTPVNPRTVFQQENRSVLGNISSAWSGLTAEQRAAWNGAVENWQKTNVFGDLTKPTGKNLFTGLNKNVVQHLSEEVMLYPPQKAEMAIVASAVVTSSPDGLELTLDGEGLDGLQFLVSATAAVSQGTSYVKNKLRTLGVVDYAAGGVNVSTLYTNRLGTYNPGDNVYFSVQQILANGQLGVPVLTQVEVTG